MALDTRELADPTFFSRLESLELRAKSIVEGFLQGLHRSPYVGFSAEFSSHREYVPGDDLRHVNWKLYARQHRLYVKEYTAETNLNLYLLLDVSSSMDCASRGRSKLQYGAALAAALAHLALKQNDAAGITLFGDEVMAHLPPRARPHQLEEILQVLDSAKSCPSSDSGRALRQAAEMVRHRGMVVIISDLFDDLPQIVQGLNQLRYRNHEVLLFQIFDPLERDFLVDGNIRFRDLETGATLTTQAEAIRERYREAFTQWRTEVDRECRNRAIDRVELSTDDPLDQALLDYFVRRAKS